MKAFSILIKKSTMVLLISLLSACTDTLIPLDTIYIGSFDNTWNVVDIEGYEIGIFRDGPTNTTSGDLRGFEDHPEKGFTDMVSGSFNGLDINFTIPGNNGNKDVTFTGKMTPKSETVHDIIRINLTTSEGENLVLDLN